MPDTGPALLRAARWPAANGPDNGGRVWCWSSSNTRQVGAAARADRWRPLQTAPLPWTGSEAWARLGRDVELMVDERIHDSGVTQAATGQRWQQFLLLMQ